jgi:hypothetical protein
MDPPEQSPPCRQSNPIRRAALVGAAIAGAGLACLMVILRGSGGIAKGGAPTVTDSLSAGLYGGLLGAVAGGALSAFSAWGSRRLFGRVHWIWTILALGVVVFLVWLVNWLIDYWRYS